MTPRTLRSSNKGTSEFRVPRNFKSVFESGSESGSEPGFETGSETGSELVSKLESDPAFRAVLFFPAFDHITWHDKTVFIYHVMMEECDYRPFFAVFSVQISSTKVFLMFSFVSDKTEFPGVGASGQIDHQSSFAINTCGYWRRALLRTVHWTLFVAVSLLGNCCGPHGAIGLGKSFIQLLKLVRMRVDYTFYL